MPDTLESLSRRIDTIERKLDALSLSVDERFERLAHRFEQIDEHSADHRQYTEFGYERLDQRIAALERAINEWLKRLGRVTAAELARLDVAAADGRKRLEYLELRIEKLAASRGRPTRHRRTGRTPKKR